MRIVVMGNPFNVHLLSYYLKETTIEVATIEHGFSNFGRKVKKLLWGDLIHIFTLKSTGIQGIIWVFLISVLRCARKKVILHWTGTDVLVLTPFSGVIFSKLANLHLAYAPWLVVELREKGIESTWLPVLTPLGTTNSPLPKDLTVLVHLGGSVGRYEFYGGKEVEKMARVLPDVNFLIMGRVTSEHRLQLSNVQYLGRVPRKKMDEVYSNSTVLLRMTRHDGLSLMVLEAMARGRYVVWTIEFPYCYGVDGYHEALECIKGLRSVKKTNMGAQEFVKNQFNNEKWLNKLVRVYKEVLM